MDTIGEAKGYQTPIIRALKQGFTRKFRDLPVLQD